MKERCAVFKPGAIGDFCPACGEVVLDAGESTRVSTAVLAFNMQVNASMVDPSFIANVRKKLALNQRKAADIFDGGINAFSRYENGRTKPLLARVNDSSYLIAPQNCCENGIDTQ